MKNRDYAEAWFMTFVAQHASTCVKSWQLMLQTKTKQTQAYFLIDQKFFIELFVLQSFINSQTPAGPLIDPMLVQIILVYK